jgi:Holliday junction resolvase RusA-like endonuclease
VQIMTNPTRYSLIIQGHNPAPQGSKAYAGHRYNEKAGRELPVLREESARVGPWRDAVCSLAAAAKGRQKLRQPLDGWLEASMVFVMRPSAKALKEIAKDPRGTFPDTRYYGDLDKLQRSTLDGLADAKVIADDARVVSIQAVKVFPGFFPRLDDCGAYIRLRLLDPDSLRL